MSAKRVILSLCSFSVFIFLIVMLCSPAAMGQAANTGTVAGTVTDQKGAAVPNASVQLLNTGTNEARTQTTNDTGYYTFVSVPPGSYKVTIKKEGFRSSSIGLDVQVGKSLTADLKLEIGTMSQTVEVTAGAQVELQTQDSSVGNVLERKMLENIPSLARDATALLLLQPLATPGFNSPGSPSGMGEGDNTGGQIAGARSDQNTFLLDGGDATDSTAGSGQYSGTNFTATPRAVVPTPIESLEEFRVVTTNSAASFSRSAGGEVQMVTRRGTTQFHGAVYEYLQNDVLNANTWDRNSSNIKNPALRDNRYGGRLGGPIWKDKTFFFVHYEGRRFVSSTDIQRRVPSCDMRLGILHFGGQEYNLNPVAVNDCAGVSVPSSGLDPRNLGLNPTIKAVWAHEPAGNKSSCGTAVPSDGINTLCFDAPVGIPLNEDFGVIRMDHSISSKWQLTGSYRYGKTTFSAPVQVDIGGLLPGDKLGVPKAAAQRPLAPRYVVASLTGQLTSHLTSQSTFDYLRHWWQWGTLHPTNIPGPEGGYAQTNGLNASLSILGEGIGTGMQPINVDTQNARSRTWNGKDYNFNENLSWVKGNHFIQFGGRTEWQRFYHQRDDKVVGGLTSPVFTIGRLSAGSHVSGIPFPSGFTGSASRWRTDYASVLGIIERSQELLTRAPDFSPNTPGIPLQQHTVVDSDSLYVSDSWRIKPSVTLTLGLNWGVQLPPYESSGEQTMVVDNSTGKVINFDNYIATRESMALAGQIYNPQLDYVPIKQNGRKYPYDPDWTNFSPRVAFAWNPSFSGGPLASLFGNRKSVLRGGYARVYDRINGVGIVMIPALGVGFGNNLRCAGPHNTGTTIACGTSDPTNAFRIGTDGTQIPLPSLANIPSGQPLIPGFLPASNSPYESLDFRIDPKRKVGYANTFDLTYQRDMGRNMLLEVGYVGNYAQQLYQGYALQAVPYMYTLGGQTFAKAWSAVAQKLISNYNAAINVGPCTGPNTPTGCFNLTSIPNQPFFESFGSANGLCTSGSCTQFFLNDFPDGLSGFTTFNYTDFWENYINGGPDGNQVLDSYIIGSHGRSNYNAGFVSLRKTTSAGLTFNFNYTFSHAFDQIGQNQESLNEASDAFKLDRDYGSAQFDRRHAITTLVSYDLAFGSGRSYSLGTGFTNKVVGGWNVSGVWAFATGLPLDVINGNSCQELGQGAVFGNCSAYFPIGTTKYESASVHNNNGTLTAYSNADAINNDALGGFSFFAPPDPAIYGRTGRGYFRGLNRWNVDFGVSKTTKITERVSTRFDCQMTNAFNHVMFSDPNTDISTGSVGALNTQYNQPRYIQFGLRFDF